MLDEDLEKVISFLESYYSISLTDNQILAINEELKGYTYNEFLENIKNPLLISCNFFTIADLHRIIENNKQTKEFLTRTGRRTWEEFYTNNQ